MTKQSQSFDRWFNKVARALSVKMGLSVHNIPDMPFRSWYDYGMGADEAAARTMRHAGPVVRTNNKALPCPMPRHGAGHHGLYL